MKSVTADLNRRGPAGTVKVSLRRFEEEPTVGDQFVVNDGEDRFVGKVRDIDSSKRVAFMQMDWNFGSIGVPGRVTVVTGRPAFTSPLGPRFRFSVGTPTAESGRVEHHSVQEEVVPV